MEPTQHEDQQIYSAIDEQFEKKVRVEKEISQHLFTEKREDEDDLGMQPAKEVIEDDEEDDPLWGDYEVNTERQVQVVNAKGWGLSLNQDKELLRSQVIERKIK